MTTIKFHGKLVKGIFKSRVTRFSVLAQVGDKNVVCFLPNPGRLEELLVFDAQVVFKEAENMREKLCTTWWVFATMTKLFL